MVSSGFHPDLRRAARVLPRGGIGPATLPVMRGLMGLQGRRTPAGVEVLDLPSGANLRVFRPPNADPAPALLWIHGGGYVLGQAAQDDRLCRRFSAQLGAAVASVDYRLAPQHPYPAALEDCWAALTRLAALPGVDPARIAIGGASAGGGLAAALAQLAADRGEVAPVLQLLVYPMLDDRSATLPAHRHYRLWSPRSNRFGWTSYLGDAEPQMAVPARRADLSGLAPAWIGVGTLDLFYDEDLAYAGRLRQAGVPCDVETVSGAFHGFDLLMPKAPVSQKFFASQCASLRDAYEKG
ncbi:alpha/beta hydrolase [Mycolicibacter hiberniae]|uniref:Esterase n=1 Tax=Mycolicibacter hiberniae TaxID=29314 RepID=A0A7I7X5D1_9MYCO|nr:alpha/beta hydrolase [Mycolicibacter hiberniae]MCV7087573.1 alpha/beta hydrolase [Mycolicibacter hiberniae]ORV72335.1 alpha/beta hydrolase [Mycolicibacter hiberniae]BBZ24906.1 esterase [Mycolicibacter hiberniae]